MLRWVLSIVFVIHGFSHLVGFVVPWGIGQVKDAPYKTTLLADAIEVGDRGIRAFGVLWLIAALAFVVAGFACLTSQAWWTSFAVWTAAFSLVLSILGWPEARLGTAVDLLILVLLILGARLGWLSAFNA
jgi:hypothetical protein